MNTPNEITTKKYGFHTTWELPQELISKNAILKTEEKKVEAMPDVRWHLEWSHIGTDCKIYFRITSCKEVESTVYIHYYRNQNDAKSKSLKTWGQIHQIIDEGHWDLYLPFIINGKLIINARGFFSYTKADGIDTVAIPSLSNAKEWGFRLKQNDSEDFSILVDGQIIQIHKLFLSVESPIFTRMFEDDFKEAKEGKVTIIDFKHEIVQAAVNYCYAQNISSIFQDQAKAIDLLYFADKYDFTTLKPKLEAYFIKNISKENILLFASTAHKTNSLQLRRRR